MYFVFCKVLIIFWPANYILDGVIGLPTTPDVWYRLICQNLLFPSLKCKFGRVKFISDLIVLIFFVLIAFHLWFPRSLRIFVSFDFFFFFNYAGGLVGV